MEQLPLDLEFRRAEGWDEFIVSSCNDLAMRAVETWPDWPGQICGLNITGAVGAGKSHLGAVWQAQSGAHYMDGVGPDGLADLGDDAHFLLDNIMPGADWDEEALFLLLTRIKDRNGSVLMLSRMPVSQMEWSLADLRSRMRAITLASIDNPDDLLLGALLDKHFVDRQLAVPDTVRQYVVARIDRSFDAVRQFVEKIDKKALADKKHVSLGLAREVLAQETESD
ncbi:DNA replication protein [Alphaproteobacteria bacterium]|nr:DNA replication protein [Alphaproteobacteria bacterium]